MTAVALGPKNLSRTRIRGTDPIFRNLGILKLHDMHLLQLGLFMYSHQYRVNKQNGGKLTLPTGQYDFHGTLLLFPNNKSTVEPLY